MGPGQEASLAPPCSNLRSFVSKCAVLKKVYLQHCWDMTFRHPANCAPLSPSRYAPAWSWSFVARGKVQILIRVWPVDLKPKNIWIEKQFAVYFSLSQHQLTRTWYVLQPDTVAPQVSMTILKRIANFRWWPASCLTWGNGHMHLWPVYSGA